MITLLLTLWATLRGVSEALELLPGYILSSGHRQPKLIDDSICFSFGYCQSVSSLQLIIFHNLRFDLPRILLSTISDESPDDSSASWKLHIGEIFAGGSVLPGAHCYCSYTCSLLILIVVDLVINVLEYFHCGQKLLYSKNNDIFNSFNSFGKFFQTFPHPTPLSDG